MENKNILIFIMFFFVFSCSLDHLTTAYGITLPTIREMNPNVRYLIASGFWHGIDLFIISSGVYIAAIASLSKSNSFMNLIARILSTTGVIRFYAGFHNIYMILQAIF